MGFIFRTIFWLSAASVIIPHGSRLGEDEIADFRNADLELELRAAAVSAWSIANAAAGACDDNPDLCKAASRLWDTTLDTAAGIVSDAAKDQADAAQPTQTAANSRRLNQEN